MKRTFVLNDGKELILEPMPFENGEGILKIKSEGWFIPCIKNSKEGDFLVVDGEKYIFHYKRNGRGGFIRDTEYLKLLNKPFLISIKKAKNCLFSRRCGIVGKIILGYSIRIRLFNKDII